MDQNLDFQHQNLILVFFYIYHLVLKVFVYFHKKQVQKLNNANQLTIMLRIWEEVYICNLNLVILLLIEQSLQEIQLEQEVVYIQMVTAIQILIIFYHSYYFSTLLKNMGIISQRHQLIQLFSLIIWRILHNLLIQTINKQIYYIQKPTE
ncbi:unnamed protein product [Paramecium primaurelia]|uniref:Transmembrane protein n=1 Tax=Paramecium primaurelia TaxID=5886 RepID=A0A8S1QS86_PARPR|nr:unnamed protein product [Paramecium primaurelia]